MTYLAIAHELGDRFSLTDHENLRELAEKFPAVMTSQTTIMSKNYQFMSTFNLAVQLQVKHGLELCYIGQQRSTKRDPAYQEHVLRFRLPAERRPVQINDSVPEIVLMNSHNGRCSLRVYLGVFRMVCANGMIISDGAHDQTSLRHIGEGNTETIASKIVASSANRLELHCNRINAMSSTMLKNGQQEQLARALMDRRQCPEWLTVAQALEAIRPEDQCDEDGLRSLWVTFNVLQENLTNRSLTELVKGEKRTGKTRPIESTRGNIITNEALWNELDKFIWDNKQKYGFWDSIMPPMAELVA